MDSKEKDKKLRWERDRVQRIIDYHNRKYGTHIVVNDTSEIVYSLQGKVNWDWVCHDTETGEEIAVEVKKLTDSGLEERGKIVWGILKEIKDDLSNRLLGTFYLCIDIPKDYYLPFHDRRNKQAFKNVLCESIFQEAQKLELGEERHLTPQIITKITFALPDSCLCVLKKVSEEGSALTVSSGVTGFWSRELTQPELDKFRQLVLHVNNEQLKLAKEEFNAGETFLVLIDEGRRIAQPYTVANAIKRINCGDYSRINHIYYVSGKKAEEIPLPAS